MRQAAALGAELERLFVALVREGARLGSADSPQLTPTQRAAMLLVVDDGPLRPHALAAQLATTDATATRTLQALQSRGLVSREPDPDDGRGVRVAATPAGRAAVAGARRRLELMLGDRLAGLPEDDRARLVELLRDLSSAVGAR